MGNSAGLSELEVVMGLQLIGNLKKILYTA